MRIIFVPIKLNLLLELKALLIRATNKLSAPVIGPYGGADRRMFRSSVSLDFSASGKLLMYSSTVVGFIR